MIIVALSLAVPADSVLQLSLGVRTIIRGLEGPRTAIYRVPIFFPPRFSGFIYTVCGLQIACKYVSKRLILLGQRRLSKHQGGRFTSQPLRIILGVLPFLHSRSSPIHVIPLNCILILFCHVLYRLIEFSPSAQPLLLDASVHPEAKRRI